MDREAAYFHAVAAKYRALAAAKDRAEYGSSPQTKSLRMAVEAGLRVTGALGDWAGWARHEPRSARAPDRSFIPVRGGHYRYH